MKKASLLFISALHFSYSQSFAQSTQVSGTVLEAENGMPLPYSNVYQLQTTNSCITDSNGRFSISITPSSAQKLAFSLIGYKSDTLTLQPNTSQYTVYLVPEHGTLNEVVVSSTMKEISKMESPIPVEVYTPALFKKNPSPTLFESLNMITGVAPQLNCNVCNTGDIHINGLEGPYTMILIDGMPIISSLATVYGLSGIPQSMVKRIEVVKGPASTLYGSEAVAGLVNVITQSPSTSPLLKTDISATSIGEYNLDFATKLNAGKSASALLGINYFNYKNRLDINGDNFTDVTLQDRISIFNKWDFKRHSGKKASLAARYVYEDRWGGEMQWNKQWRGTDSVYGESIYTNRIELIGTYELPARNQHLRVDYSYNYHLQDSYYGKVKYAAYQHTAFAQLLWDKDFGKWNLLAGLPFRFMSYDDNTPATASGDSFNSKNKPANTYLPGVFLQSEIKPTKQFTTLVGLRYDYNSIHGSILTPRLSFKYAPNSNNTFRLTGGSGYRVVNLYTEDHAALTGARDVVIASDLKPEKSWNANLNYAAIIRHEKGFVNADFSLFYTYFTNQIVADYMTDATKIIYNNLNGYAISKGATVNLDFSFTNGIKLIAGFTVLDVFRMMRDSSGNLSKTPQLFAPAFSANYAVSYSFKKIGLSVDWTGRINSPMHLPVVPNDFRPEQSPWYCLMNLQLTKKLPNQLEIYGGAKNLLNFIPNNPILRPNDPFDKHVNDPVSNPYGYSFDPSYNYAPVQGIKYFLGVRWMISQLRNQGN